jgi:hypothetical protein
MPQGGVSARAARRAVAPWWEELDSEAFREFPAARRQRITKPAAQPVSTRPVAAQPPSPAAPPRVEVQNAVARVGDGSIVGGQGIEGRRTVTIRGRGAERNLPIERPTLRRHERPGYRPDRTALWAVALGVLLILVAAASAHAAVLSHLAH